MDRIFKRPFLWPELYRRIGRVVNFRLCLMKNPLLYRSAWPERGREASERFLMETLGRTQSKRRRWIALASGIRLLRSESGMGGHVLDAPTRVPHFPPIAQRRDVVRPGFDGHLRNTSMAITRKLITAPGYPKQQPTSVGVQVVQRFEPTLLAPGSFLAYAVPSCQLRN